MKVLGFYKKGAQVVVAGGKADRTRSFDGGRGGDVQIGVVPADGARQVSGAAWDLVEHKNTKHLLLKKGFVYEVELKIGDVVKNDVVSAEADHLILALPNGAVITSVSPVVEEVDEPAEGDSE